MDESEGIDDLARRSLRELITVGEQLDLEDDRSAETLTSELRQVRDEFVQLRMHYQFGIDEVQTKVNILRQEFEQIHDYSPIEHVRTRLKSVESLIAKAVRTGGEMTIPAIRERIQDIAGIRITCSFVSDAYWIADMLRRQPDLTVLKVKDYIERPKPNGYRSLHLILEVPVFLSEHTERVPVELQIRTIAMDFWASVEHKLSYKYGRQLPAHLSAELADAAQTASDLDQRMARMREEIRPMADRHRDEPPVIAPVGQSAMVRHHGGPAEVDAAWAGARESDRRGGAGCDPARRDRGGEALGRDVG